MACRYKIGDGYKYVMECSYLQNLFTVRVFYKFWEVKENVEK